MITDDNGYKDLDKIDDTSIYTLRKLPTGAETTEVLTELTGASVGWNQWVQNGDFADGTTGWSCRGGSVSASGNIITCAVTSAGTERGLQGTEQRFAYLMNHVYLLSVDVKPSKTSTLRLSLGGSYGLSTHSISMTADSWNKCACMWKNPSASASAYYAAYVGESLDTTDSIQYKYPQAYDLTVMLGSTIADYVYTLESGTAGAGVAWLKEHGFIDGAYHAYDAGSIQSVNLSNHETVGFNQWDEEWEVGIINSSGNNISDSSAIRSKNYIPALENTVYKNTIINLSSGNMVVHFYDANKNHIVYTGSGAYENGYSGNDGLFTTPAETAFMRFRCTSTYGTTYNYDICINISDASRNGTYEPYNPHSYPLDSSLQLLGIPKLDENNQLYYDGDTYRCDGRVVRKYGIVDLGSLTWTYLTNPNYFYADVSGKAIGITNCFSSRHYNMGDVEIVNAPDRTVRGNSTMNRIYIVDSAYTDAATFKTAMSGVYLVYELATPIVKQADSFTSNQSIDPDGTESFVGGLVPPQAEARFPTGYAADIAEVLMPVTSEMRPVDTVPTADSEHLITSGGVKSVLDGLIKRKEIGITGINSTVFTISDFSTTKGITKNIIALLPEATASLGTNNFFNILYNPIADECYVHLTSAPSNGVINCVAWYL